MTMVELKVGDALRVVEEVTTKVKSATLDTTVKFVEGQVFTVDKVEGQVFSTNVNVKTPQSVVKISVTMGPGLIASGQLELLRPIEEAPEPPEPDPDPATYRLSYVAVKLGRNRPATNLLQLASTKLGEIKDKPEWALTADGVFGSGTESVVKSIQAAYSLAADGIVGTNTWHAMTPDLGTWRSPMQFRISECQCTFESGTKGYGYYGAIYWEGWFNYGIWNCNRWSAKRMLQLGNAPSHLAPKVDVADEKYVEYKTANNAALAMDDGPAKDAALAAARVIKDAAYAIAADVAYWYGTSDGRETQTGEYFLVETLKPSIKNLVRVGFVIENFGISSLDDLQSPEDIPNNLAPFYERLLTLSCDITINSGAGGFFPKKSPRAWDAEEPGDETWPADRLPFKEEAKQVYSEVFGQPIPDDFTYVTSDTRETYANALTRCLAELCQNDEQRIELIAELQSRCIIDQWRNAIIQRRRAVARRDGYTFQGSYYNITEQFGLGI